MDEVIQNNSSAWISSGEYEQVIQNFFQLLTDYSGASRSQIANSLIEAFDEVSQIPFNDSAYEPYLLLLLLRDDGQYPELAAEIMKKFLPDEDDALNYGVEGGILWSEFLVSLKSQLERSETEEQFIDAVETISLPNDADFTLGIASMADEIHVPLRLYKNVVLDLSDDHNEITGFATEYSHFARETFAELKRANLVKVESWKAIGNQIVNELRSFEPGDSAKFSNYLDILVAVWIYTGDDGRGEIDTSSLMQTANFYRNLHVCFESNLSHASLGSAVFIARQQHMNGALPNTHEHNSGTISPEARTGHEWFKSVLVGQEVVGLEVIHRIVDDVIAALQFTNWITHAKTNSDALIERVIRESFIHSSPQNTRLNTLLDNFGYLEGVLKSDFPQALEDYASRSVNKNDFAAAVVQNTPIGLLTAIRDTNQEEWDTYRNTLEVEFTSKNDEAWQKIFEEDSHGLRILSELIHTNNLKISSLEYRKSFLEFAL